MENVFTSAEAQLLANVGQRRFISRLAEQKVELCWDYLRLQMRAIDLQVLCQEMDAQLAAINIDVDEAYILTINEQWLYLTKYELRELQLMVNDATEKLPSCVIRWKEIALSLRPLSANTSFMGVCCSQN